MKVTQEDIQSYIEKVCQDCDNKNKHISCEFCVLYNMNISADIVAKMFNKIMEEK